MLTQHRQTSLKKECPLISIVIPAHNEKDNLYTLLQDVKDNIDKVNCSFEMILIDDGSTDGTYQQALNLQRSYEMLHVIRFSRNFGHQAALLAGMRHARGKAVITMDADLQHPPRLLPLLVAKWREGYQVIHTVRDDSKIKIGLLKRWTSKVFYALFAKIARVTLVPGMADFRLVDKRAVEPLTATQEYAPFFRALCLWVGFKQAFIRYSPDERYRGQTSYTFRKMLYFAVNGLLSFSHLPLYACFLIGLTLLLMTAIAFIGYIAIVFFTGYKIATLPLITVMGISFLSSVHILLIGMLGLYLGAVHEQVKGRPQYIIKEESFAEKEEGNDYLC